MKLRQLLQADQWVVAALFFVLSVIALYLFVTYVEPDERKPGSKFTRNYQEDALASALTPAALQQALAAIDAASLPPSGSPEAARQQVGRVTGSVGCQRTRALIEETFRAAHITPVTQRFQAVVPVTEYCEVTDAAGTPLPEVTLYPFQPAGLVPIVTIETDPRTHATRPYVSGRLVTAESSDPLDLVKTSLEGNIVVNNGMDCSWSSLAALGVKAVLVKEDPAEMGNPDAPAAWNKLDTPFDAPYPRFLVRGPIERYADKDIRIRCKVTWQAKEAANVIGVLKAAHPSREALIVTCYYDSYSLVPELAPGGEQALSLAALLNLVQALAPYRETMKRDVIFIATAGHSQSLEGVSRIVEAIETISAKYKSTYRSAAQLRAAEQTKLDYVTRAQALVRDAEHTVWTTTDNSAYRARWQQQDAGFRKWFEKCFTTVAGDVNLEQREIYLQKRLAWIRGGRPIFTPGFDPKQATDEERKADVNRHPLLRAYQDAKDLDTQAANIISVPCWQVASQYPQEFTAWQYQQKLLAYLEELRRYHTQQRAELDDVLQVQELFNAYDLTFTVNLELYSGGSQQFKDLAVLMGRKDAGTSVEPQSTDLRNAIAEGVPMNGELPTFRVTSWGTRDASGGPNDPNIHSAGGTDMESEVWFRSERLGFTVVNKAFLPAKMGTPQDTFTGLSTGIVAEQLPPIGKALLAIAHGKLTFKKIEYVPSADSLRTCRGAVLTTVGTSSLVPNHPMWRDTFVHLFPTNTPPAASRNVQRFPFLRVNPYGEYYRKFNYDMLQGWGTTTADAASFAPDGTIKYYKDLSAASQTIFKNETIPGNDMSLGAEKAINIALFRCTPVACYQRGNPKTLNAFPRFDFLMSAGMAAFEKIHLESGNSAPGILAYMEPDASFVVAMMDGSAQNKDIQTYRAFMLNNGATRQDWDALSGLLNTLYSGKAIPAEQRAQVAAFEKAPELAGDGYLAADTPNLTYPYFDGAASMLRTNARRMWLQQRYHMADEPMLQSQQHAQKLLKLAWEERERGEAVAAVNDAGRAMAAAINNHPVIRGKIANAVFGILWYLALLVPFVFFFEKLLFGFTDIRKQLLANGITFIVVFMLLRYFHPAFHMVGSAQMILLGFLMLLLSVTITFMVTGKFQQTIKVLRRKEGYVEGADINRAGVIGTAFMLGLNNMRRRKVRTGLTCLTLVLITFVMICFTSVSTDVTVQEYPTSHYPANGLMRRDQNFAIIADSEVNNITQIYGLRYPVTTHYWLTGALNPQALKNTDIVIDREYARGTQQISRRTGTKAISAALTVSWNESYVNKTGPNGADLGWKFSDIAQTLLTKKGWFPKPPVTAEEKAAALARGETVPNYVMLPEETAKQLDLTVADVDNGRPTVLIRGEQYEVWGIFDSEKMTKLAGMDGESILPYNLNSIQNLKGTSATNVYVVPQNIERLKGSQVIICTKTPAWQAPQEINFAVSTHVLFPHAAYRLRSDLPVYPAVQFKEQRTLVDEYLERVGILAYYSIQGISYSGQRTRAKTPAGLLELIIPLLIAALTVFNTMRGSVYERKDEIYVYNAVGIAPNHIFFMFMAEACVYAVIGAMAGYLLSQVVGTGLTITGLTGGLNMDYSSIETIIASVAIVASVLLSTLVPAYTASRLALPSDEVSWTVPKADGDVMRFNLPFTFTAHDRVAIISYFHRWLDANGEGSSGSFFCAPPTVDAEYDPQETRSNGVIPAIETTVWLKPFDLGVSQRLRIALPTDPETDEYIASITIERLSGTISAWNRTIMPFLTALRKQFLNWRAVSDAERTEMFAEAKSLFEHTSSEERETAHV